MVFNCVFISLSTKSDLPAGCWWSPPLPPSTTTLRRRSPANECRTSSRAPLMHVYAPRTYISPIKLMKLSLYCMGRTGGCGTSVNCTYVGWHSRSKRTMPPLFPMLSQ